MKIIYLFALNFLFFGSIFSQEKKNYDSLPEKPILAHPFYSTPSFNQTITLNDKPFNIHYKKIGSGEPLLLVHGLMTNAYSFRYVIEDLAKHYMLIIPDMPGAGKSDACPNSKLTPELTANVLKQFLDSVLPKKEPIYIVGNSLGGYQSIWFANLFPSYVKKLMVIHSPGFRTTKHWALHIFSRLPFSKSLYKKMVKKEKKFTLKSLHYHNPSIYSKEEINEYSEIFTKEEYTETFYNILKHSMSKKYMRKMRKYVKENQPDFPVFLLWAEEDDIVPPRLGPKYQKLFNLPDSRLRWLKDASHFTQVDAPKETIKAILEFDNKTP